MLKKCLCAVLLAFVTHGFCANPYSNTPGYTSGAGQTQQADESGSVSVDAGVGVSWVFWTFDDTSHRAAALTPQIGLSYAVNDVVAPRLFIKYASAEDGDARLDAWGFGFGSRFWLPIEGELIPFLGGYLRYDDLSSNQAGNLKGAFGVSGEAGVGYWINNSLTLTISLSGDTALVKGKATLNDHDADISLSALCLGAGLNARF